MIAPQFFEYNFTPYLIAQKLQNLFNEVISDVEV